MTNYKNWWTMYMVTKTEVGAHTYGPDYYTHPHFHSFYGTEEDFIKDIHSSFLAELKRISHPEPKMLGLKIANGQSCLILTFSYPNAYSRVGDTNGAIITITINCLMEAKKGYGKRWNWRELKILNKIEKLISAN